LLRLAPPPTDRYKNFNTNRSYFLKKQGDYYSVMPCYFFDTRDDDEIIPDDVGLECPNLEAVKMVASKSLAELACDVLPGSLRRRLGVNVRDEDHRPVMIVELTFEARVLLPDARYLDQRIIVGI
jgi:hypothetical protein